MVKKIIAFGIMLIMLFSLFAFAGCVEDGTFPGLSAKTENKIKQTYLDELHERYPLEIKYFLLEDIITEHYCGTYNGYIVVMLHSRQIGGFGSCTKGETVAGVDFWYPDEGETNLRAWKGGKFSSLTEAYDNGWLTKEDIENISNIYESQK